jgi:type IV fimbrial biogenesis protein FimT
MRAHGRVAHGFTLIEQILVLALTAILTGLAIPAMHGLLRRNRTYTATQAVNGALRATRMLAIERQRRSVLCPSRDGRHCSGQGDWQAGWLVGVDADGDGQPDGTPILAHPPLQGVHIRASRGRSRVYYHPNGSAPGSNLTLRICPAGDLPDKVSAVVVSNSGRIRLERINASHCR